MLSTMLRFFLIVFISFLPKIAAKPNDGGNIFFESSLRSGEIHRRQVRSTNDESSNAIDEEDSDSHTSSFHFNYRNTDEWGQYYPECNGKRQSPIDVNYFKLQQLQTPSVLEAKGYDTTPSNMTFVNNGHGVHLSAMWDNEDQVPYLRGGNLDGDYTFVKIYYHWGSRDDIGCEHTVEGKSYPLEIHMVHYKKDYGSLSEAMKHEDGLVIVGIHGKIAEKNHGDRIPSQDKGIAALQKYAEAIKKPNSQVQISPFPLSERQKIKVDEYVTYLGSLTAPPCSEIVTWILLTNPKYINEDQMDFFRSIEFSNGDDHNYRPTMPVNGRNIYVKTRFS